MDVFPLYEYGPEGSNGVRQILSCFSITHQAIQTCFNYDAVSTLQFRKINQSSMNVTKNEYNPGSIVVGGWIVTRTVFVS